MNDPTSIERLTARVTIDRARRSGQPCIRNLRITGKDIPEYLAGGMTKEQLLEEFPSWSLLISLPSKVPGRLNSPIARDHEQRREVRVEGAEAAATPLSGEIPQRLPITLATAHSNQLTSLFVSISR